MRHRSRRIILITLLIILAVVIFLPRMSRAHLRSQENAAIVALRRIQAAQMQYQSRHHRYADSLAELRLAATASKNGYTLALTATSGSYEVTAVPPEPGGSDRRRFLLDAAGIIHQHYGPEPATSQDPTLAP